MLNLCWGQLGGLKGLTQGAGLGGNTGSGSFNGTGANNNGNKNFVDSANQTFKKRDYLADSITIHYRYLESTKIFQLDTIINDFQRLFQVPYHYFHLGNMGTALQSFQYEQPKFKTGFRFGYDVFEPYLNTLEKTKFYNTSRPYTEIIYQVGSKQEQQLGFLITKNIQKYYNFSIEYNFRNFPGFIKNQAANQTQIRFTQHYLSKTNRYELFFVAMFNKAGANDNGGLVSNDVLYQAGIGNLYGVATRFGSDIIYGQNPFTTTLNIGHIYKHNTLYFQHHYDFGKKDSLKTDSLYTKIFYPKFRIQHSVKIEEWKHNFVNSYGSDPSSIAKYQQYFGINDTLLKPNPTDLWRSYITELNLFLFPNKFNTSQYLNMGAGYEINAAQVPIDTTSAAYHNFYVTGSYINRTRNLLWDLNAQGTFYLIGRYAGNFTAHASISRLIQHKKYDLKLGAVIINRNASIFFSGSSNFYAQSQANNGTENITQAYILFKTTKINWELEGNYYIFNNYFYLKDRYTISNFPNVFNLVHAKFNKKFNLTKILKWYNELNFQLVLGNAPLKLPLLFTRQRLAIEGYYQKNLQYSIGLEGIYATPFNVQAYNPINGQFSYQDTFKLANFPNINFFINLKIRRFVMFLRFEEINSFDVTRSFQVRNFTFQNQYYPHNPFMVRFGFKWGFIN
ncbi:MAG: hypothetical protein QM539_09665 [Alphaproteobacteria bacterium]|nr:hypothetical protein [Alphaproteobacteria bacterium]